MKTLIASLAAVIAEPPSADRDLAVAIEARRRTSPRGCRAGPTRGRWAGSARATGSTSAADPEPGTPSSARPPWAPPCATADARCTISAGAGSRMTTPACGAGPRAGSSWRAVRRSRPRPAPSTLARPGGAKGFEAASIPWRLGSARTQWRAGRPELRRRRAPQGSGRARWPRRLEGVARPARGATVSSVGRRRRTRGPMRRRRWRPCRPLTQRSRSPPSRVGHLGGSGPGPCRFRHAIGVGAAPGVLRTSCNRRPGAGGPRPRAGSGRSRR